MIDTSDMAAKSGFLLPKAPAEGIRAALLLAFIATAGLFYVNLGGAFLSAFVDGMGLSREMAGYVTSANKYGAAFGALVATFAIGHITWRKAVTTAFVVMIIIDLLSMQVTDGNTMIAIRFLHGSVGGFSVGIGLSLIGRTKSPDKGFGMLLFVQYGFGSLGIYTVPRMVESLGHSAVFWALICFTSATLLMVPFVTDFAKKAIPTEGDGSTVKAPRYKTNMVPFILALAALFLFQASNMGLADYLLELGKSVGMKSTEAGDTLALAGIISISGGALVYFIGTKYGRVKPLAIGMLIAAASNYAFHWSSDLSVYFIANAVAGTMWGFLIPYLLGLVSTFDDMGRMAAFAGFVSKMGLASGPLVAAMIVGEGNFDLIINVAVTGLILCGFVAFIPAHTVDKIEKEEA